MKGFDVLKVKSAIKNHNKFDLSRTHLTTMNFGQIVPLFAEETIPGDKFKIGAEFFSRLAPLAKPTYGKFMFKTVAAFVPYHQVAYDSDAWLAGKTTWEGQTPIHRWILADTIHTFILSDCLTTAITPGVANTDYNYIDANGNLVYNCFSEAGKYYVKVLNSLGYALPQGVDLRSGSSWMTTEKNVKYSAYPFLAFFKLYNDFMSQSQRFNTSPLSTFLQNVKYNRSTTTLYTGGSITAIGLSTAFSYLNLNYENDYFTSAWQKPNSAINSVENVGAITVPQAAGYNTITGQSNINGQQLTIGVNSNVVQLTQRALDFLKSFDDWVRRNNYSGSRAVQQLYSRFGIKTDDYRSHYANVLSTDSMPIQVGDVTSTADSGVVLGDYAGKGIMSGSKSVSCEVSDYGLILILGYFTVAPMNAYGSDRKVLRNSPLDYYNPEFDGLGADAISYGEVYATPIADSADTSTNSSVFGYTERYNAYRYGRDMITGEFRNYHSDGGMNVWHSGRLLTGVRKAGNMVAQSSAMNTLPQTNSEYNRIFSVSSGTVDHFYLTANFKVDAIRPMLNLNQVTKLGEGDTTVPRNGNVIS